MISSAMLAAEDPLRASSYRNQVRRPTNIRLNSTVTMLFVVVDFTEFWLFFHHGIYDRDLFKDDLVRFYYTRRCILPVGVQFARPFGRVLFSHLYVFQVRTMRRFLLRKITFTFRRLKKFSAANFTSTRLSSSIWRWRNEFLKKNVISAPNVSSTFFTLDAKNSFNRFDQYYPSAPEVWPPLFTIDFPRQPVKPDVYFTISVSVPARFQWWKYCVYYACWDLYAPSIVPRD